MTFALRPATPSDAGAVRQMCADTLSLGRPSGLPEPVIDRYVRFCTEWYLNSDDGHTAIAELNGEAAGYVMVCTNQVAYTRWERNAARSFAADAIRWILDPRTDRRARRFLVLRFADAFMLWRDRPFIDKAAHAHFNLVRDARNSLYVRSLIEYVDDVCRRHDCRDWVGEMNARAGQRVRVIERHGFEILHHQQNETLTWLTGERVVRLTTIRRVGTSLDRRAGTDESSSRLETGRLG